MLLKLQQCMRMSNQIVFNFRQNQIQPKLFKKVNEKKKELYYKLKEQEQQLIEKGILTENLKQQRYIHKENYNFEQYLKYTKLVREQLQLQFLKQSVQENIQIPRRKRRVFIRTKHDWKLDDYYAWPNYYNPIVQLGEHCTIVACKILVPPKSLEYVFGRGQDASRNSGATKEYEFQDSNLDYFLLQTYIYQSSGTTIVQQPSIGERIELINFMLLNSINIRDNESRNGQTMKNFGNHLPLQHLELVAQIKVTLENLKPGSQNGYSIVDSFFTRLRKVQNKKSLMRNKYWKNLVTLNIMTNTIKKMCYQIIQRYLNIIGVFLLRRDKHLIQMDGRITFDKSLRMNDKLEAPQIFQEKYKISFEDYLRIQEEEQQEKQRAQRSA